jgi:hypothetical protein
MLIGDIHGAVANIAQSWEERWHLVVTEITPSTNLDHESRVPRLRFVETKPHRQDGYLDL